MYSGDNALEHLTNNTGNISRNNWLRIFVEQATFCWGVWSDHDVSFVHISFYILQLKETTNMIAKTAEQSYKML